VACGCIGFLHRDNVPATWQGLGLLRSRPRVPPQAGKTPKQRKRARQKDRNMDRAEERIAMYRGYMTNLPHGTFSYPIRKQQP